MQTALTLVVALGVVVAAPSPREQAKALYGAGKKLCQAGDADGCLAKRLEGHKLFPNVKVIQAIVSRYQEVGDVATATAFLEDTVAGGKPANAMKWSKKKLADLKEAQAAAAPPPAAAPAAPAPVVVAPPVPAPTPTPTPAPAQPPVAEPKQAPAASVKPAKPAKSTEQERRERQAQTKARAEAHDRRQAKLESQAIEEREAARTQWMILGWSSAALAVAAAAGGVILVLDAQSESDAARACQSDLDTFGGGCSEGAFQSHRDAQASSTTTAFVSAGAAAIAAGAATTFLYLSSQVGEAAGARPSLLIGPGGAWLSVGF